MKNMTRLFFALGLVALVGVAFAQDAKKKDKKCALSARARSLDGDSPCLNCRGRFITAEGQRQLDTIAAQVLSQRAKDNAIAGAE